MNNDIRVRMAPSPTGSIHIGTLRTVLYDYLFAKKNGGKLVLRIEDTDQSREVEGAVKDLLLRLRDVGIEYDEGPFINSETEKIEEKGNCGPYTQSKRLDIYKKYVDILLEKGNAYHCFCTPERLDEMRKRQQQAKQPPMYDRTCCSLSKEEIVQRIEKGEKVVVRMKVPRSEKIIVDDIVRGRVEFSSSTVDDQVIMKSDGFPTYHLAVVVDDYLMKISHVIRGEEWLPSTPKHIILYNMFGWDLPQFAHLPLLLNENKSKLSKRQGDVSVEDFLNKGYLKEALINFVAFLGWNPGGGETREKYTLSELVGVFELAKVHKSGAVVDIKKLGAINSHYIRESDTKDLYKDLCAYFQNIPELEWILQKYPNAKTKSDDRSFLERVLTVEKERLERLIDFGKENPFFFETINLEKDLLRWKENSDKQTVQSLTNALDVLSHIDEIDWTRENIAAQLMDAAGENRGSFLWPLRAALTGAKRSPSPMDCAWVIGKKESLKRIKNATALMN